MNKKTLLFLIVSITASVHVLAQNQAANLDKYWSYRQRLRDKFIAISGDVEQFGVNIPASHRDNNSSTVDWGDANNNMSHYLTMLATELYLLKNNGQDYSQTLNELFYAMVALERMDMYSEYWWRWRQLDALPQGTWIPVPAGVDPVYDVNGMYLREDVTPGFWANYYDHFQMANFTSVFNRTETKHIFGHDVTSRVHYMEEISQDNMYHTMEGLALVNKLVGTESIASVPRYFEYNFIPNYLTSKNIWNGSNINFSLWAQDMVKRYIAWMQAGGVRWKFLGMTVLEDNWALMNPVTGEQVEEGSGAGNDYDMGLFYNAGAIEAGKEITGEDLRTDDAFVLSNSASLNLFKDLFNAGPERLHAVVSMPWPLSFDMDLFDIYHDDYKIRTLSTYSNLLGDDTFNRLRISRDNTATEFKYEHMPLLYCALFDETSRFLTPETSMYNTDRTLIESLLNSAPTEGPTSSGPYDWSSASRLVWPEKLGDEAGNNLEYSGLDYMVLHNLYYMGFRREDFRNKKILNNFFHNAQYSNGSFRFRTVEAANRISDNGNVKYYATESIVLKPGFVAESGSQFIARIESRASQYQGALYVQPGPSGGRIKTETDRVKVKDPNLETITYMPAKPVDLIVTVDVSEDRMTSEPKISAYPNPTKGKIVIEFKGRQEAKSEIQVLDLNGKAVLNNSSRDTVQELDLFGFPAGIYLIKILYNGKIHLEKVTLVE